MPKLEIMKALKAHHVVEHKHNGQHISYAIYWNNKEYLAPESAAVMAGRVPPLKKRTAFKIAALLNEASAHS